jgi:hypothetical protein
VIVRRLVLVLALMSAGGRVWAQDAAKAPELKPSATPVVVFQFDRPGLPVPDFTMSIGGTSGQYVGMEVVQRARETDPAPPAQPFGRPFMVSAGMAKKIVGLAQSLNRFNTECASKAKNIADTGKKRLTYTGPDGTGECTYNFTENKFVQQLTDIFQGIAETMDEGRRLEFKHRFDRLGLDAELESFSREVAEGRAMEVGTIAPVLRSLADDSALMQRVHAQATKLLAGVPEK